MIAGAIQPILCYGALSIPRLSSRAPGAQFLADFMTLHQVWRMVLFGPFPRLGRVLHMRSFHLLLESPERDAGSILFIALPNCTDQLRGLHGSAARIRDVRLAWSFACLRVSAVLH